MKTSLKPFGLLFLIMVISYFPLATFIAGVKNDILTGYLPVRFFMSESLSAGYMPWWNPYVNFGIPQYADMSSSFWSPITWLIAGTVGYNIYTITIELLLYIFVGGLGMYKCGEIFHWGKEVKLIAAISYMCCGYMVGHIQHLNWIAGAGLLPLCFWSYHFVLTKFSVKGMALSTIFFYLLIASSHPGISIGSIYFFTIYCIYMYWVKRKALERQRFFWSLSKINLLLLILLLAVSAAMIISYIELFPFITRGEKISSVIPAMNSNTFQSWISFLFPMSTVKNNLFYVNDISLRNNYIGITMLIFLFVSIVSKKGQFRIFMLLSIFFLTLSSNNYLHTLCLRYLPLIGYVRLNGEFRIFGIFALIISSANSLQCYMNAGKNTILNNRIILLFCFICGSAIIWAGIKIALTKESIFFYSLPLNLFSVASLKQIADKLSFYDVLFIQSFIQLLLFLLIKKSLQQKKLNHLLLIIIADLCMATLLNLPFTGVGTKSTKEIQSYLNQSPKEIPVPTLQSISDNDSERADVKTILGSWSLYNKQPGTVMQTPYPIEFKNEKDIFEERVIGYLKNKPFLFFSSQLPDKRMLFDQLKDSIQLTTELESKVELIVFTPTHIRAKFGTDKAGELILLYQNYPYWKCTLNEEKVQHDSYLNTFIKINIPKPRSYTVDYIFNPIKIKIWMIVSTLTFTLLLVLSIIPLNKRK